MTRSEFTALPYLLAPAAVTACGYSPRTVAKYFACGILTPIQPRGFSGRRAQKRQVAQLLDWSDTLDLAAWQREKPLLGFAAVHQWTGYGERQLAQIVKAGGLTAVNPGGVGRAKYRKEDVAKWLGL
jgi:hypothetical protein